MSCRGGVSPPELVLWYVEPGVGTTHLRMDWGCPQVGATHSTMLGTSADLRTSFAAGKGDGL
jgi:hypothetical protein